MKKILIFLFLFPIILAGLISASVNTTNYTLQKSYYGGQIINGVLNISFKDELNKEFTTNFGSNISLLDLLSKGNFEYICNPLDCEDGYSVSNGENSKVISPGESVNLGFAIYGFSGVRATNLSFDIQSNASESCVNQFYIDFLNYSFFNTKYLDQRCSPENNYGCFDSTKSFYPISIPVDSFGGTNKLCERISLPAAPAYRIGANLLNGSSKTISMYLYDMSKSNSSEVSSCSLNKIAGTSIGENDCLVNYSSINPLNAIVCISSTNTNNVSIKYETESIKKCGATLQNMGLSEEGNYGIYAFPLKYAVPNTRFDSNSFVKLNGVTLQQTLDDYMDKKYGSLSANCSKGCVVPIEFYSRTDDLIINNVAFNFNSNSGSSFSSSIYDISKTPFIITTDNLKIDLKSFNITVPNINGTSNFKLDYDGKNIISQTINITSAFAFDVSPKVVAVAKDIEFSVNLANVSSVLWDFGDGSQKVTSADNKTTHRYSSSGQFKLTVTVTKKDGSNSQKIFDIISGNAKDSVNSTLQEYSNRIKNISSEINGYPSWIAKKISEQINLSSMNDSITYLKDRFNNAVNDSQYEQIASELYALNVPYNIYSSVKGDNLPLFIGFDNINLAYLAEINNDTLDSSSLDRLKADLATWISENYDAKISFEVISKQTDSSTDPLLTRFKIILTSKGNDSEDNYLIFGYPKNLITFSDYLELNDLAEGSVSYLRFSGNKNYEFILSSKSDAIDLGAYVAPPIYKLGTYEPINPPEKPKFKTGLFWTLLIILLIVFLIIYIILQEWYKRNYESKLFKNKADLFNVINFIYNSRVSGMRDSEIKKSLEKSGWNGEQISYAFKKIDGKRTGMWEIPIFGHLERGKVKKEIAKTHPEGVDARFINQPKF